MSFSKPEIFSISVRLPITTVATVEAMAKKSRRSRNQMMNLIIESGLRSIKEHLALKVQP